MIKVIAIDGYKISVYEDLGEWGEGRRAGLRCIQTIAKHVCRMDNPVYDRIIASRAPIGFGPSGEGDLFQVSDEEIAELSIPVAIEFFPEFVASVAVPKWHGAAKMEDVSDSIY